jgi:hypothetical protein
MGRREQFTVNELTLTGRIVPSQNAGAPDAIKSNLVNLTYLSCGAPALADDNQFVTTTNMKVGAYTLAATTHSDSLCRNLLVTVTQGGGVNDTMGTLLVTGTDYLNAVLTETITPSANSTAVGIKCFKTITSIVGAGWARNGAGGSEDTIIIGEGDLIQIPCYISAAADIVLAIFDTAIINAPTVTVHATDISKNTINATSLTYDGTKKLRVLVDLS